MSNFYPTLENYTSTKVFINKAPYCFNKLECWANGLGHMGLALDLALINDNYINQRLGPWGSGDD